MVPPDALSGRVCARILNLMVMLWPGASAGMVHCSGPLVAFSAGCTPHQDAEAPGMPASARPFW